ncbi:inhibitor of nuclear factor kappa-B kinase subunit epsilon isoform X2 [Engraulis encrasicolus]
MNHLRENGVVHRDIKPGNILRQVGEDGRSIYKLTDFGAARELEDDEKFHSIYGTEEYLHPDMYERAVLRKPQQKAYGVTVDLWSIGVTFYHAASGSLPFVPYGGPRRNKHIMYKITTEKPTGAIAGMQRVEDGPIDWSYQLPIHCQLSEGLKEHLVPVLSGILEANQEKCWGFDQFLTASTDVLHRTTIHLFHLQEATTHTIYIHFYNTVSIFCEEVQAQSRVDVAFQCFLFQGHRLQLEGGMKVVNLPPTSRERPLFLVSLRPDTRQDPAHREPESPPIPTRFDVMADYSFTKVMVGVVHQYLRMIRSLLTTRDLVLQGFYSYIEVVRVECEAALPKISIMTLRLHSCLNTQQRIHNLNQLHNSFTEHTDNNARLLQVQQTLAVCANGIKEFQNSLDHLQVELAKLRETLAGDKSIAKVEILLEKIMCIHQQFRKDRSTGKLSYNDEQIHKFEKINLSSHIKKVKSLYRDDCTQKLQDVLNTADAWTSKLYEIESRLRDFSTFFIQLMEDLQMCEEEQNKCLDEGLQRLLQTASGSEGTGKDHMILRMNRLKDEMEAVARELQTNNMMIESLGTATPGVSLPPDMGQPKAM